MRPLSGEAAGKRSCICENCGPPAHAASTSMSIAAATGLAAALITLISPPFSRVAQNDSWRPDHAFDLNLRVGRREGVFHDQIESDDDIRFRHQRGLVNVGGFDGDDLIAGSEYVALRDPADGAPSRPGLERHGK